MSWGRMALSCLALAAACRDQSAPARNDEESPGQRVFLPPPGVVRAVPPHRIEPDGVGPYRLGAELKDLLNTLPEGPRVELLQIDRMVGYRLVRVAQDKILVGIGPDGRVSFIAALDPEIAKTEGGLGVGSDIAELREALGPELPMEGTRDPRLVELEKLPNARVVVDRGRAAAIVVRLGSADGGGQDISAADALSGGGPPGQVPVRAPRAARTAPNPAEGDDVCTPASAMEALADQPLASIARIDEAAEVVAQYGCFTGNAPEAVIESGDELVLVVGEPGHLRRAAALSVPGLHFASAVDIDGDGRQELVAVSEKRSSDALAVRVEVLRGENGRLVGAGADEVYRVTAAAAAPVGARLKDIELLVEAYAADEALTVTGLYLHRVGAVRTVAPLLPKTIVLRPRRRSEAGGAAASPPASASPRAGAGARGVKPDQDRKSADGERE